MPSTTKSITVSPKSVIVPLPDTPPPNVKVKSSTFNVNTFLEVSKSPVIP